MGHELLGLRRHLGAEISEEHGAFLFSERGVTVLRGSGVEPILALLDGTRTMADLLEAMPQGVEPEQAATVIEKLMAAGFVTALPSHELGADERVLAYWDACGAPVRHRTNAPEVAVVSATASLDAATVAGVLTDAGLTVAPEEGAAGRPPELAVVVCDDYLDPQLAELDRAYREAGVPWLLAKPVGTQVWIGPIFRDGHGCWHCLAHRLWHHRDAEACAQRALGKDGPARRPACGVPALEATALNLVALEAEKWLAGVRHAEQQCVWTLDTITLAGSHHELRRRPQCPECGDPSSAGARAWEPVVLPPTPMVSDQGGYRAMAPQDVLARYRHLISPVTGIVKEITRDPRGPASFHSYRSGTNVAAGGAGDLTAFRHGLRDQSGGKGATAIEAEVGALCEAVERYSGTFHGDEARIHGSFRDLGEQAVHPDEVLLLDARQHADRLRWNRAHGPFHAVGPPFDETEQLDWTPVWSLTRRCHRLLPTALLYFDAPAEAGGPGLRADSNGNAAGSSLPDAVLQGLLELVERDAVALWWYNRVVAPGVDLDSFGDDWVRRVGDECRGLGRDFWALDLTADLGIPVFAAVSRERSGPSERIVFGFGAHLDPHLALRRAVAEHNQFAPVLFGGTVRLDDPDAAWWFREATVAGQPYLAADPNRRASTTADHDYRLRGDIRDDVESITGRLAAAGMDTMVLDQTRPDIGLPVVKVIVPGLRHFRARFGPGRLFDVPVALGLREVPTPYDELNPIPLFV